MLVKCQHEGCTNTIETEAGAKFTCREHSTQVSQEVFFQSHQFDLGLDDRKTKEKLSATIDIEDTPGGMHFFKQRMPKSIAPEWTQSDAKVRELIERIFPKWRTSALQCVRASRWASVIYLHYRLNLTLAGVADELEITEEQVRNVLNRVKRVSKGRSSDNTVKNSDDNNNF